MTKFKVGDRVANRLGAKGTIVRRYSRYGSEAWFVKWDGVAKEAWQFAKYMEKLQMYETLKTSFVKVINPSDNGGESVTITTEIHQNEGETEVFLNQFITLQSYGNSATFNLCGTTMTPKFLRELADEIEFEVNKVMK